jgi:hypothetical protein
MPCGGKKLETLIAEYGPIRGKQIFFALKHAKIKKGKRRRMRRNFGRWRD